MSLHADATDVLSAWSPLDREDVAAQRILRDQYLEFLAEHPDGMWRACRPGHLTASVLVLSEDRTQVLLTLHPKIGRWLQLGGHCEPDDRTLADAAIREGREESGLPDLTMPTGLVPADLVPTDLVPTGWPGPLRLDRHRVSCHGGSWHLDVQYVAVAALDAVPAISAESEDLAWWPVDALPPDADHALRALVRVATTP